MDGKKITGRFDFNSDYTFLKFDDGTAALVKVINPELSEGEVEELGELLGVVGKPEKVKEKPEAAKKGKKAPAAKKKELSWDDLKEMDHDELSEVVKSNKLDVDPDEYDEDEEDEMKDFLEEVAEELEIGVPEEEDEKKGSDDKYTWDDLSKLDFDELVELIEEEDIDDVDEDDYDEDEDGDEDKLRIAIAKSLGVEAPVVKKGKKK